MRRLIAALACRVQGSRLYGKPLQNLAIAPQVSILDHLIGLIQTLPAIEKIVLGIASGSANQPFVEIADRGSLDYIIGDQQDVLQRLIQCGHKGQATDIFRITTESPFFYYELVPLAWERHLEAGNDVTTVDGLPEGAHFEIYTLASLEASHALGQAQHRSEYCSLYIREHRQDFQVEVLAIPPELARPDLRLTVDYPEDLVLCRQIYQHLQDLAPQIPLKEIIAFLDHHPELQALVEPYVSGERLW